MVNLKASIFLWAILKEHSETYSGKKWRVINVFDISEFDLVKPYENKELYDYQYNLIEKKSEMILADFVLELALVQAMTPIEDYYVSISILQKYYEQDDDIRVGILGAHLSSVWECYKDNKFLPKLKETLTKLNDNQQKSIIYYLLAHDMFRKEDFKTKKDIYMDLLTKSVNLSEKFVYNYYHLAELSNKKNAKSLMQKAFTQIESILNEESFEKFTTIDFISYNFYLNEHILGIDLSDSNFDRLVEFYNSLNSTKKCSLFKIFG